MEIDNLQKILETAGQLYEPPYDSPIEDILARNLLKHIRPEIKLDRQVEVETPAGTFRMDFVLVGNDISIGLECDGEEFHDPWRDEWRDAMILFSSSMDDILRIPGSDIWNRLNIALCQIAEWYPAFFSKRGQVNVKTLAEAEADAICEARGYPDGKVNFSGEAETQIMLRMVHLERRSHSVPYLTKLFAFAMASSHSKLDAIIEEYSRTSLM